MIYPRGSIQMDQEDSVAVWYSHRNTAIAKHISDQDPMNTGHNARSRSVAKAMNDMMLMKDRESRIYEEALHKVQWLSYKQDQCIS